MVHSGMNTVSPTRAPVRPSIVLLALAMGGFAIGTAEFAAMSLLPFFSIGLGVDEPAAGHVISIYAFGVVIGAPVIAVLGARMPRRTLLLWLMGGYAIANSLSAIAPTYETMLLFRFISGLPHGAYFGVAALTAASLVPPNKRAQAMARIMLGLTVSTIIGVPMATSIGLNFGWRWGFGIVGMLGALTVLLIWRFVPQDTPHPDARPLRELKALTNKQVWLTLGIGAIGFGGLFAVYTFVASTLLEVTLVPAATVPVILAVFGVGMTTGTLAGAWLSDRIGIKAAGYVLLWSACSLALYPFATGNFWAMCAVCFLVGNGGGLGTILQSRLMDVAGDGQTMAASLNHSAFNFANALGPLLAGMAIAAGYGFPSSGWVGCGLALGGLAIWAVAVRGFKRV